LACTGAALDRYLRNVDSALIQGAVVFTVLTVSAGVASVAAPAVVPVIGVIGAGSSIYFLGEVALYSALLRYETDACTRGCS